VIPARGGSKGIPRKNLAPVAGKPLLYFTARAAQGSTRLTRTVLSTEDEEVATVGRSLGLEVPFLRPVELATDHAGSSAVAKHALVFAEGQERRAYDAVCLLQPTSPLRTSADIDAAIQLLEGSDADAVVSLTQVEEPHPLKMMVVNAGVAQPLLPDRWRETLRRQELPAAYFLNGAVYCARRAVLLEKDSFWGTKTLAYVMPAQRSVNIDTPLDLRVAELMLAPSPIAPINARP